jgi:hypothetical protein
MANDGWESLREEARRASERHFSFAWTNVPGCRTIAVCIPSLGFPVGTVWFRFDGNRSIETLHSFVIEKLRRCGLRTALHKHLIWSYPTVRVVLTANGTDDGGEEWLKSAGFTRDKVTGDWKLSVNRRRAS